MRLTQYGPGDYQTWGGRSPEPSDYDDLYDLVYDEMSDELYSALQSVGMEDAYDVVIDSSVFVGLVERQVDSRVKQAEEDRAEAIISAREWD